MPCLGKALEALVEDVVNVEAGMSMTLLEGFICCFQCKAGTPLDQVNATLVKEPDDKALFKWACSRGKLETAFP